VQVYRKAALKIVKDLGEDVFPEPTALPSSPTDEVKTVETVEPPSNPAESPIVTEDSTSSTPTTDGEPAAVKDKETDSDSARTAVTTEQRKPMQVPDSVHVRIGVDNLKEYVGPPIYHKDRLYTYAPPAGVSTGLGYLGNGSGAVMPVEASVSFPFLLLTCLQKSSSFYFLLLCVFIYLFVLFTFVEHARKRLATAHWKTWRSHPGERPDWIELGQEPRFRVGDHEVRERDVLA